MQVSQIKPTGDLWPQPSWAKCLLLHQLFMAWPVSETEEVWHLDHLWCLVVRQPLSMGIQRTKCAPVGLNFIVQVMLHGLCWKSIAPELDWESVFPNLLYQGLVKRLFAQLLFRPIENVIQINDLSSTESRRSITLRSASVHRSFEISSKSCFCLPFKCDMNVLENRMRMARVEGSRKVEW